MVSGDLEKKLEQSQTLVPLSKLGAELLFEVISQCYERGS
jgi:hypothetical protein